MNKKYLQTSTIVDSTSRSIFTFLQTDQQEKLITDADANILISFIEQDRNVAASLMYELWRANKHETIYEIVLGIYGFNIRDLLNQPDQMPNLCTLLHEVHGIGMNDIKDFILALMTEIYKANNGKCYECELYDADIDEIGLMYAKSMLQFNVWKARYVCRNSL